MEIYVAIVLFLQKPLGLIPIRCNSNSMLITRHLNSIMNQFTFLSRSSYLLLFVLFFQLSLTAQDAEKKVALTTFFVDRQIDVSDLSGNAAFVANILTMAKDSNFNLQPVLDDFKNNFFTSYAQQFPFSLMPESEILENADYQAFEESIPFDFVRPLTPDGYKVMYPGGILQRKENRNQNEMLRMFPTADGVMYVFMNYAFVKKIAIGGMGTAGIRAFCSIWLYNKEGKNVFRIYESANSKGTVGMVAGVPIVSVDKILPLCHDASANLFEDLKGKLPKIAKKAAKKL